MSQLGQKTITTHILSNISRSESNQTMKFKLNRIQQEKYLSSKIMQKWGKETSSRPFFVFSKVFTWSKIKWSAAWFLYILIAFNLTYNDNKLCKTLDCWSRDILNFDFLEIFWFSINWPNFIVWLSLLLEILCYVYIAIACFPGCDVINFEINLFFLIKSLSYMSKKWRQKLKYLEKKKRF